MPGAQFSVPPAPIRSPLELGSDGLIKSPAWIAWFLRIVTPVLQEANAAQTSVDRLLDLGKHSPGQSASELYLQMQQSGGIQARDSVPAFPPPAPRAIPANEFPPAAPRVAAFEPLSLLSALGSQRQLPVWSLSDTHANRSKYPNSAYPVDTLFTETDRLVLYRNTGAAWVYVAGTYSAALASIPTLGTSDAGFLFSVTDYAHVLKWSGTAWGWGPGESGSGYFQDFAVAPTGSGWHACDGSAAIAYLKADGTTATVTLPNTAASAAYRKNGATYASAITAAVSPTVTPTGTVAAPVFTGTAAAITNDKFTLDAGGTTALKTLDGSATTYTPRGTNNAPAFTGALDTVNLPGDPIANYQGITYFRI